MFLKKGSDIMKVSELTKRDIINIADGARLGAIKDIQLDLESGKIEAFILQGEKKYGLLRGGKDIIVPWEKIKKIGLHTVLVEVNLN